MDAGIGGSNAGTSLRASLLALNNPAKAQAKIMEQLGFSMQDSEGNAKSLEEMIRDMSTALEGETEAQKVATLGKLVGTEAVSGFLALMKAGPDAINENTAALENSAGASQEAADKMMAGIGGALEELSGAFESAAILIGDQLVPYVMEFAKAIGDLVNKFNEASPAFQNFVVIGTAVTAAFALIAGPILLLIGFIPQIIAGFSAVSTVFAALTGPIGLIVLAIAGIVAALVLAYNKVEWFRDAVDKAWAKIKDFTLKAFEAIKDVITKILKDVVSFAQDILGKFKAFWDENGAQIMALVKLHFGNIWETIKMIMGVIKGVFEVVWAQISAVIQVAWRLIKTIVSSAIDIVLGVIQTVMKVIQGDWAGAWETIKETVGKIWGNIKKYFDPEEMKEIGINVIKGLIKGIGSMVDAVGNAIKNIGQNIKDTFTSFFGIKSPSRLFAEYGENIGEGLENGMASTKAANVKAITGVASAISSATRKNLAEINVIADKAEKDRTAIQKDYADKRAELARKSAQSSQSALKTHKNKKGEIVTTGEAKVYKIRQDASAKLTKLNEDEQAKLAKVNEKAWADMQKKEAEVSKMRLESVKTYVADKKSLEQLSLVAESEIWRKSIAVFAEGTKERIVAQQEYQKSLKVINDEITKTNEEYAGKMTAINDKLRDEEKKLTDAYTKTLDDRTNSLRNFAGIFDEIDVTVTKSGSQLLANLRGQVDAFTMWQTQIDLLATKAIDGGLLAELREMGPKALPELLALNSLTGTQLTQYSALYQEKSKLARTQAEAELIGMKTDTATRITELRAVANTELEALRAEWVKKIESVTKATDDELKSLKSIGQNAGQGLLNGLASMEGALVAKARSIANAVSAAMASALQVKSPSRVTMRIGEFVGAGLMVGMESMLSDIKQVADQMGAYATPKVPQIAGYQTPVSGAGAVRTVTDSGVHTASNGGGFTQHLTINAPKALSPAETARLNKQASQRFAMEVGLR